MCRKYRSRNPPFEREYQIMRVLNISLTWWNMHCSPEWEGRAGGRGYEERWDNDLDALCMRGGPLAKMSALLNNRHFTISAAQWYFVITTLCSIHLENTSTYHFVCVRVCACAPAQLCPNEPKCCLATSHFFFTWFEPQCGFNHVRKQLKQKCPMIKVKDKEKIY